MSLENALEQTTVSPNSDHKATHEFERDAFISQVEINTTYGQEYSMLSEVYVISNDGSISHVVEPLTPLDSKHPKAIGGEGQMYELPVRHEVERGDTLVIEMHNTSSNYTYHGDVTVQYDEEFGSILSWLDAIIPL